MPGRRSKFSTEVNGQIKVELFGTLAEAGDYDNPTIAWIQEHNMYLSGFSQQKLSRSLGELVELGFVRKGKSKSGRMVYRLAGEYLESRKEEDDDEDVS